MKISIVIPTRNRAYILDKTMDSYYCQKRIKEIILVDDFSSDNTRIIVKKYREKYKEILTRYIYCPKRVGAAVARNIGFLNATSNYILFGEDDVYLEKEYSEILFEKWQSDNTGSISGRLIYMDKGENPADARKRFGMGEKGVEYFDESNFSFRPNAYVVGDILVPFSHAIILTKKELLVKYKYDPYYAKGNGFREETDYQINIYINRYDNILTSDTSCCHVCKEEVRSGGQRVTKHMHFFYNIRNTFFMYDKYYIKLRELEVVKKPMLIAKAYYVKIQIMQLYVMPIARIMKGCFYKLIGWDK